MKLAGNFGVGINAKLASPKFCLPVQGGCKGLASNLFIISRIDRIYPYQIRIGLR